ncbi:MAG: hypothetical protein Q7T01_04825 [bacterium]|nr:hypothetical protein [bacterium]
MHHDRRRTIELAVFFVVIAVMGSGVLAGVQTVASRTRDARRAADIAQLQRALAFAEISEGAFPVAMEPVCLDGDDVISRFLLEQEHLRIPARDPVAPSLLESDADPRHCYTYQSRDRASYTLRYFMERSGMTREVVP